MNETFWRTRAQRERFRFNTGWLVQFFLPWVMGIGLGAAVLVLALRTAEIPEMPWAGLFAVLLVLAGAGCSWFFSRKKFLSQADALARLDVDLRLHNRLISASHGVGAWPAPQSDAALALTWNWRALLWPPAAAVAVLVAAFLIPVPAFADVVKGPRVEPSSWTATQEKIDALRKEEIVQPEAIKELQETLDALRKQPGDQWYKHESLEAGDHLQAQTEQALAALQKNLETALGALEASREIEQNQLAALSDPLNEALSKSLQAMELGALPLDQKMADQLKNLDVSKLRKLSDAECKALAESLKNGIQTCSGGFCKGEGEGDKLLALILGASSGRGGISRGPGAAPLTLSQDESQLGTKKTEAISNEDLSHAALGDLMGLGTTEHKVDKAAWTGPAQGGDMVSPGAGGEAVWDQAATPEEQAALRRFFK